jgi:hypothetical protein
MSTIARQFFADSPVIFFPILALLLFLVVFVVLTVRAIRTRPEELDALARIPFGDEEEAPRHE